MEGMKLTEKQAWLYLAERFGSFRGSWCGICVGIGNLCGGCDITEAMNNRMVARLYRHKPRGETATYWWPLEDKMSRVLFCRKMASLCVRKVKK